MTKLELLWGKFERQANPKATYYQRQVLKRLGYKYYAHPSLTVRLASRKIALMICN